MCLIILKPAKAVLPEKHVREGWISNPDGGGYAFAHRNKVVTRKGITTLKEFQEAFNADSKQYKKSPFVLHFRIRTHGDKTAQNTHPFEIADGVLAHNGSLDGTGAIYGTGPSDTNLFCKAVGDKLTLEWVKANLARLSSTVSYNKFVMLYKGGQYQIVNEKDGVWLNDVWYSNHTFKPRPAYAPPPRTPLGVDV